MKKILPVFLAAVCLTAVAAADQPPGAPIAVLRKPESEIKAYILALTPPGASSDEVLKTIKLKLNINTAKYEKHFYTASNNPPYADRWVEGWIRISVGSYSPSFFGFDEDVVVEWDFDSDGRLKDVAVIKYANAL